MLGNGMVASLITTATLLTVLIGGLLVIGLLGILSLLTRNGCLQGGDPTRQHAAGSWPLQRDFAVHFADLTPQEQTAFRETLSCDDLSRLEALLHGERLVESVVMEQIRQFNDWAMREGMRSVTPFDCGGYVQGSGFNPSDTMAHEAQQQQMILQSITPFDHGGCVQGPGFNPSDTMAHEAQQQQMSDSQASQQPPPSPPPFDPF